ncbi:MAG: Holliday junction resolvase RuvX [candidate division WOR-3 bacterium]
MGRILGIDYGERFVGFAISDEKECISSPLFEIDKRKKSFKKTIKELIEKYKPYLIVFGEPRSIKGEGLKLSEEIKKEGEKIEKEYHIKVVYWDEWESSKLARKHKKKEIHSISAAYILQDYLNFKYNKKDLKKEG